MPMFHTLLKTLPRIKPDKPQTANADYICHDFTIDSHTTPLTFSAEQAIRKARTINTQGQDFYFEFAQGQSGYLIEKGNPAKFSLPHPVSNVDLRGYQHISIHFDLHKKSIHTTPIHLFCFFCRDDGEIIKKEKLSVSESMNRVGVPHEATKLAFAIRLSGTGYFSGIRIAIDRHKTASTQIEKSASLKETTQLIANRDYRKAIARLSEKDDEAKHLLRAYTGVHDFENLIQTFESLNSKDQSDISSRLLYIRALANIGATQKLDDYIYTACLDTSRSKKNMNFLVCAYPFAVSLSNKLADMVLSRILTTPHMIGKPYTNHLMRCAHDLINQKNYAGYFKIIDTLMSFPQEAVMPAKLDILLSQAAFSQERHAMQMAHLNKAIACHNNAPLVLKATDTALDFKNISCPSVPASSASGPLVSVLMTAHNSASTIEYALRSLMSQSYATLEILVMDDNSQDDTCDIVAKLAAQDLRIRLIKQPNNGGTYVAKNTGLAQATGTYFTCQDSDDWAHPQKIERLMLALESDKSVCGVGIQHVRYDPVRGYQGRGGYIRPDASSMMYRRAPILSDIGYYDCVRAGADSEFQFRVERHFGLKSTKFLPDLLSLVLWSEKSLSGGGVFAIDDDAGVFTQPRNTYRRAFCDWQEATPHLYMPFPCENRPFDVPHELLP